ncbi:740_t:CDS:2 [Racocetra fulgida]|uniref:740_t:CDS:1 n=1 Tax=Racocetra fulgida TaxID=60492 RepID=A0A9N8W107_9GLOM|nr:740_t:CDS:2 [Racocetra fulgida]
MHLKRICSRPRKKSLALKMLSGTAIKSILPMIRDMSYQNISAYLAPTIRVMVLESKKYQIMPNCRPHF